VLVNEDGDLDGDLYHIFFFLSEDASESDDDRFEADLFPSDDDRL